MIRNASSNYMVQDLCFFLQKLGVRIEGIGTTTLTVTGCTEIDVDVDYSPSEDPIEAMTLLAAAIVTDSEITVKRVPIEFIEIELAVLEEMGFRYDLSEEYLAANGQHPAGRPHHPATRCCTPPLDKIHPMPFPGLNIDNLPFFAVIAATAQGQTLLHDWVYENRAHLPHRAEQARRPGHADGPAPGDDRGPDPLVGRRGGLPARRCARPS